MIITEHLCSERPTNADISAFEKLIHGTLPEDYKAFLKNQNGGRPQPRRFRFTTPAGREEDSALHYFFALYEGRVENLKNTLEILKGRIPSDCLPIATDPFGNVILLGIADQNLGRVYFWDHEKEDENSTTANISPIARSFSEFVEQLA
jgi:hypothetical protein